MGHSDPGNRTALKPQLVGGFPGKDGEKARGIKPGGDNNPDGFSRLKVEHIHHGIPGKGIGCRVIPLIGEIAAGGDGGGPLPY
jgi:hypothetical protein